MDILKIFSVCIIGASLGVLLKSGTPSIANLLAAFVSVGVVTFCIMNILPFVTFFNELVDGTGFSSYAQILFKVCGIGILTRSASEICKDCGENVYANKVMMAGKTAVLLYALPVIKTLFVQIKGFMN